MTENNRTLDDFDPNSDFELVFKITTRVKATNKTPEMVYLSATKDLPIWVSVKKELKEFTDKDTDTKGIIFAEHGFWATNDQIDRLIGEKKIKVEMK